MIGSTLALLTRSLRVDARLLRHHLFRLLFVAIIYFSVLTAQMMSFAFGAPGLWLFQWMSWSNLVFITLAGLGFFASAVTEEKEEETLGLLKMAGVRPLSLLLGKSTSRLLTAGVLLSLQFPFTLLAITLGGVSIGQIFAVYLALLAYLAAVANLALVWSVFSRRTGGAAAAVFLTLLAFFAVPPIVRAMCRATVMGQTTLLSLEAASFLLPASEWLCEASIVIRLESILSTGFGESPLSLQVVSNFGAAAVLFALSWSTFNRFTRDQLPAAPARGLPLGRKGLLKWLAAGRTWSEALVWKDFHFITGGKWLTLAKLALYGLVVLLFASLNVYFDGRLDWRDLGSATMISMLTAGGIELALYATRIFHTEIRFATWSPLLLLPLSLPRIIVSKVGGCLLALFPATAWLAFGAVLNPDDFIEAVGEWPAEPGFWITLLVYALFLHITTALTLFVKWGALPLAIGIMFFGMIFFQTALGLLFMLVGGPWMDENLLFLLMGAVFLTGNVGLEIVIVRRLRHLAAR